jgi:hypothetical protein
VSEWGGKVGCSIAISHCFGNNGLSSCYLGGVVPAQVSLSADSADYDTV